MTKKDFEAIAEVLNANAAPLSLVLDFADMCEESNPRFNRALFVQASTAKLEVALTTDRRMLARAQNGKA